MLKTFDCPKCGAPVTYDRQEIPGLPDPKVRCNYCGSTLIVPDEIHGQPARVVNIDLRSITRSKPSRLLWMLLAIPVLIGLAVVVAMLGILTPLFYSINRSVNQNTNQPTISRTLRGEEKPADSFAKVLLKFGEEGIGPGMFKDARSIAVDGSGRIYVGEYTGGRIQVFDAAGKFLTQWSIGDRKTILRGLAADRKGTVYVASGGRIDGYRGETGEKIGQLQYEKSGFDDVSA